MPRRVTFTLDDETLRLLAVIARRVRKPDAEIIREAILGYCERTEQRAATEKKERYP